jgi:hypothetical protein
MTTPSARLCLRPDRVGGERLVPNTLGVDYNAHVIGRVPKHVAPALGWRRPATR